jgi:hypothetical protein
MKAFNGREALEMLGVILFAMGNPGSDELETLKIHSRGRAADSYPGIHQQRSARAGTGRSEYECVGSADQSRYAR